jgi:TonB family protein
MGAELLPWLLRSALLLAVAIGLVLALRRPLRRGFGARVAYALWLLLPAVLLASLLAPWLPPSARELALELAWLPEVMVGAEAGVVPATVAGGAWSWSLWLWLGGAVALAGWQVQAQRRFRGLLGPLRARGDGSYLAARDGIGPALLGLLRPQIVLPADFEQRYSAEQRALVLDHERVHLRRGDLWINAAMTVLQCLYWFNPLIHLAARRLRVDQELACDAVVISRHPHARRRYADAMLNTQLAVPGLPVGCLWQSSHPLKERISMLKQASPSPLRLALGLTLTLSLAGAAGLAVATAGDGGPAAVAEVADVDQSYRRVSPPVYPAEAIVARQSGDVVLRVLVGADGTPQQIEVERSSTFDALDRAAIEAVEKWMFNPGRRDGVAAEGWVLVPIAFRVDGAPDEGVAPPAGALDTIQLRAPQGDA